MVGRGASLDGCLFLGGTDGSNPVPSSRESTNFRFLGHRRAPPAWFLPEELCRFSGHTAMEPNRGVRGAALCPCPHHLTETTARHFLPHLRYRSRSLRSRTLTAWLSAALNRTPVGSCAWRVPPRRGCIEYGPAINAEGIGGFQTKFPRRTGQKRRQIRSTRRPEGRVSRHCRGCNSRTGGRAGQPHQMRLCRQ